MIFCRCVSCGAEGQVPMDSDIAVPPGWSSVVAAFWPVGTDMGPLFLRICGGCFGNMIHDHWNDEAARRRSE